MRRLHVKAMMLAGGPDFVEQEGAGDFEGAVQVVGEAAFFSAGGRDEGAQFGFEGAFLAFFGAGGDGQRYGGFGGRGVSTDGVPGTWLPVGGRFLRLGVAPLW